MGLNLFPRQKCSGFFSDATPKHFVTEYIFFQMQYMFEYMVQ